MSQLKDSNGQQKVRKKISKRLTFYFWEIMKKQLPRTL